jgi:hypothetical protein
MKIDIIFLVILGFMVLRTICNNKADVKEHMAVSDEIKNEIKAIYNADVTAIQNLSDIANKLQTGGYTCPGDYTVTGKMTVKGALDVTGAHTSTNTITATNLIVSGANTCNMADIFSRLKTAEAEIAALKLKTQFINTTPSTNTTITPNVTTFSSRIVIDIPMVTEAKNRVGLSITNANRIELITETYKGHYMMYQDGSIAHGSFRTDGSAWNGKHGGGPYFTINTTANGGWDY